MKRVTSPSTIRLVLTVLPGLWLAACAPEPPPPTVQEFLEDERLLEATMVRCTANRADLHYAPECANAREAVDRIAVREERARRATAEKESARKVDALRRAREAAEAARARAEEAERLRREAEYLSNFGDVEMVEEPAADTAGDAPPAGSDLNAVREELRRRQEQADDSDGNRR